MILPMADVVFFDLDGTLVDHRGAVLEAIGQIVQAAPNATVPPEELVTLWWTLERRHMQEYLAGQCSFAEQRRRRLRSFLPMLGEPAPESPGLLDGWFAERYLTVFEESWRIYPDVQPCLETLKRLPRGPRLAVLTNGDPGQQRAKLARFGLLEYFEAVLTPTELGAAKPDRAAFATACRRMRTDPVHAVNVGDMLEGDVTAAALAGLTGIWLDRGVDFITGGPPPTPDGTVLRIERLTDLPDQLLVSEPGHSSHIVMAGFEPATAQPRDCVPAFPRARLLDVAGRWTWQAPPGWPKPPDGWVPGPNWAPDPGWPPPPPDWQWWRFVKTDKPLWYRRARVAGVAAVALFYIGELASFPFVYGDPAPGTTKEHPGWFQPVGDACIALLIVGVALLLAPVIHMRHSVTSIHR